MNNDNSNNNYPIYTNDINEINDDNLSMSRFDRRRDFDFDRRRDFDFDRRRDFDFFDRRRDFDFFDRRFDFPLWFFFWPFFFR